MSVLIILLIFVASSTIGCVGVVFSISNDAFKGNVKEKFKFYVYGTLLSLSIIVFVGLCYLEEVSKGDYYLTKKVEISDAYRGVESERQKRRTIHRNMIYLVPPNSVVPDRINVHNIELHYIDDSEKPYYVDVYIKDKEKYGIKFGDEYVKTKLYIPQGFLRD